MPAKTPTRRAQTPQCRATGPHSDIMHQVSLDVSEHGTEATAITTGSTDYSGDGEIFKAERRFLFFIRHEPSLVNLFYGVVMDPTNGDYD